LSSGSSSPTRSRVATASFNRSTRPLARSASDYASPNSLSLIAQKHIIKKNIVKNLPSNQRRGWQWRSIQLAYHRCCQRYPPAKECHSNQFFAASTSGSSDEGPIRRTRPTGNTS
jgi:hypothetical protein